MNYSRNAFNTENRGEDSPDILIPPLVPSISQNVSSNGFTGDRNGKESSDSRSWKFWKNSNGHPTKVEEVPAGPFTSCNANDTLYPMNHLNRGKCIILNHTEFDKSQGLTSRAGSEVDVNNIQLTFSRLGFCMVQHHNMKYEQIMNNLKEIANEDHSNNDCLVVFVLTHGEANQLHAYDIPYTPSSLWSFFTADKCPTLAGKPKMFFIQACRGDRYDHGTELTFRPSRTQVDGPGIRDNESYRIPNHADFLNVFSTFEAAKGNVGFLRFTLDLFKGFFSWRNSRNGGCFIQALCKIFGNHSSQKDVLSMMTLVNRDVAINYESHSKEAAQNMKKQIPHVCHTLTRDIYLVPRFQSTLV